MPKQSSILIVWKAQSPVEDALKIMKRLQNYSFSSKRKILVALPLGYLIELHKVGSLAPLQLGVKSMLLISPGSFTATIAGALLKEASANFVLIGSFSERTLQGSDQSSLIAKIQAAVEEGVAPILCIGETWEQYESEQSEAVLKEQLADIAPFANANGFKLVYEAPWLQQNPHLTEFSLLKEAYQRCQAIVNEVLGSRDFELFCGVPDELQNFDALAETVEADGYFFTKGTYYIPFTPELLPEAPRIESTEEDSPEDVANLVEEALMAAAAENELNFESPQRDDSEGENDPKRPPKNHSD